MKLLVSVKNAEEVVDAIEGGADIVDVKDPSAGSLGLPDLDIVKEVIALVRNWHGREVSMALGDVDTVERNLKYIAFVGGVIGVDYIKVGLATDKYDIATEIARQVAHTLKSFSKTKLVLVGYADYLYVNTVEPLKVVEVAVKVDADGVMIDTLRKNGLSTPDILSIDYLKLFVEEAHKAGLFAAIAGGLRSSHIPLCMRLGFDVLGVRGAVCERGRDGKISRELAKLFKTKLIEKQAHNVRKECC